MFKKFKGKSEIKKRVNLLTVKKKNLILKNKDGFGNLKRVFEKFENVLKFAKT